MIMHEKASTCTINLVSEYEHTRVWYKYQEFNLPVCINYNVE